MSSILSPFTFYFNLINTKTNPGCNSARRLHNDIGRHRGAITMTPRSWNGIKINVNRGEIAINKLTNLGRCDSYDKVTNESK